MSFEKSPFDNSQNLIQCAETVRRLCHKNGIAIPENAHFVTHLNECNPIAIEKAFYLWSGEAGVHTFVIPPGNCVTRLCGEKTDGTDVTGEKRVMISRGANRPPQPVILTDKPFQETDEFTLIIFPYENKLTLFTAHSGPAMPPDFEDQEWIKNALCYRKDEIEI